MPPSCQLMSVGLLRIPSRSCWCAGTRRAPCSPSSGVTLQCGQSVGSPGCSEKRSPLRSALRSNRGTLSRSPEPVCKTGQEAAGVGVMSLSQPCLCIQVPFAAILVHSLPQGSHRGAASTQVSAATICCSEPVLQAPVCRPCSFTSALFQAPEVSVSHVLL